jgi:3-(3-hydroxy-phenyl)propionate hydroxylase
VRDLIDPWLGAIAPDKVRFVRRATYTFRGVIADRWQRGRVLLLGDAAHQTPPFIGQGMCAGIRDAANLAWKAALVVNGTADERILATYEQERRPYAKRVVQLAVTIGWLMTGGTMRTARLRRALLRAVTRVPGIEDRALETTWPAFSTGPLVQRRGRRSPAGRLLPQPRVRTADGRVVRLDSVLGNGFAVLYRGPDAATSYEPELREWFDRLGTTFVRIGADVDDVDGVLTRLLDAAGSDALLLRPDRVIAADAARLDLRAWQRLLISAGITPTAERSAVPIATPVEVSAS